MSFFEIFLIGVGLSMDAFAVAVCKGLGMKRIDKTYTFVIAAFFGGFQAAMPLLGWFLGSRFAQYIEHFDHWIAFLLLAFIGGNMIRESREEAEGETVAGIDYKELFLLAVATSIDALAVGVSFAFSPPTPGTALSCIVIGCTTFVIAFLGAFLGSRIPGIRPQKAEIAGGLVLIGIGIKLLLEGILA